MKYHMSKDRDDFYYDVFDGIIMNSESFKIRNQGTVDKWTTAVTIQRMWCGCTVCEFI